MSKIEYRTQNFDIEALNIIAATESIIAEYGGHRLTVRQIYYRFISANLLPASWCDPKYNAKHRLPSDTMNTVKNYKRLAALLTDARYAGMIDWDHIEDRNRKAEKPKDWKSGYDIVEEASNEFRLDRWRGQYFYIELFCEKAALAGVLSTISKDFHVGMMINKGYSSASAMKESADRILYASNFNHCKSVNEHVKRPVVLYIGDHDPSGEDMVRDVKKRLVEFGCPSELDVRKVALNIDQVKEFDLPTNPAKITDPRAKAYIEKFGEYSWEVDALPPDELEDMITKTLSAYIDKAKMDEIITEENKIKAKIKTLALQMNR